MTDIRRTNDDCPKNILDGITQEAVSMEFAQETVSLSATGSLIVGGRLKAFFGNIEFIAGRR